MSSPRPSPGSSLQTRPTLLFRVREHGDPASWEEFYRLYRRLVYGRARARGLSHADAEDVAQEVFQRVAETIRDFDPSPERGSFRGWLMQLTRWRIADRFAALNQLPLAPHLAPAEGPPRTATLERLPAPEENEDDWDREWRQHLLAAAAERVARQVKPRHFQVFDLYVLQQTPMLRVAADLKVSPASVYVISHRLKKMLKAEVAKLQQQLG